VDRIVFKIDRARVLDMSTDSIVEMECLGQGPVIKGVGLKGFVDIELSVERRPESLRTCLARWWRSRRGKLSGGYLMPNKGIWNVHHAKPKSRNTGRIG